MCQDALHDNEPSVVGASVFLLWYEFLNRVLPTYLPTYLPTRLPTYLPILITCDNLCNEGRIEMSKMNYMQFRLTTNATFH